MIYVTNLKNTSSEFLTNISVDFKMEQSVDGNLTASFTTYPDNNPGYDLLTSESIINIHGYEFKVKQYRGTSFSKSIVALSTFFDLNKTLKEGTFEGSHTLINHINFLLSDTDWYYEIDPDIEKEVNYLRNLGNDNIVSLLNKVCQIHECEYIILPNKSLRISKQVGSDNGYQYRYNHNIYDVILSEDTSNLTTYIQGFGANGIHAIYESPNLQTFGKLEAPSIRDDRFTDVASLTAYLKSKIIDEPEISIESSVPELTERETGERIWLIYEPLNIKILTRILVQNKSLINGELITTSVVLGNSLLKSAIDLIIEQKADLEDNKSYINETKDELDKDIEIAKDEYRSRFEQTDDRIALEVENVNKSIASLEIRADSITTSVSDLEQDVNSRITQTASSIRSEVEDTKNGLLSSITQTADEISTVIDDRTRSINSRITQTASSIYTEINDEVEGLNSSITQTAKDIRSEINDEVNGLNSSITQTAASIRSEINDTKNGLQSSINQTASSIRASVSSLTTAHNNAVGVINEHTSSISAVEIKADSISSRVSSQTTQITNLGTRISSAESSITQHSNEISARVKSTDFNGDTLVGLINLTSTTATISARNINLRGAVTVLSDLSDDLGTITSGNIDIYDDVKVGDKIYLNGSGYGSGVYFDRWGGRGKIYTDGNTMTIYSDALAIDSMYGVSVYGGMDFTGGRVTVDGDDVAVTRTNGLGFGYSSAANRLYVSINGSDVGYIDLT